MTSEQWDRVYEIIEKAQQYRPRDKEERRRANFECYLAVWEIIICPCERLPESPCTVNPLLYLFVYLLTPSAIAYPERGSPANLAQRLTHQVSAMYTQIMRAYPRQAGVPLSDSDITKMLALATTTILKTVPGMEDHLLRLTPAQLETAVQQAYRPEAGPVVPSAGMSGDIPYCAAGQIVQTPAAAMPPPDMLSMMGIGPQTEQGTIHPAPDSSSYYDPQMTIEPSWANRTCLGCLGPSGSFYFCMPCNTAPPPSR